LLIGLAMGLPGNWSFQKRHRRTEKAEIDRRSGAVGLYKATVLQIDIEDASRQIDSGGGSDMLSKGRLRFAEQLVVKEPNTTTAGRIAGDIPLNGGQRLLKANHDQTSAHRDGDMSRRPAKQPLLKVSHCVGH